MVKKLKKRFVASVIICVFLVTFIVSVSINIFYWVQVRSSLYRTMSDITSSNFSTGLGQNDIPGQESNQGFGAGKKNFDHFKYQFAIVFLDSDGNITSVNIRNIVSLTEEEVSQIALKAFSEKTSDNIKLTRYEQFYYSIKENNGGYVFAILDASQEINSCITLMWVTAAVFAICLIITALIAILISPRAIKPVIERDRRQTQFMTDASHELKTPIAIIQANIEALEIISGKNKWTDNIRLQSERLIKLVKEMSFLNKIDEESRKIVYTDVDLGQIIEMIADEFDELVKSENKNITLDIQPNILVRGASDELMELIRILLDNSVKYSSPESDIIISLKCHDGKVNFSISNKCEHVDEDKLQKLFERFYRPDNARTQNSGGSGIGLSIAKAIVESHGGKISVSQKDSKVITFAFTLRSK